jgi:TolB-like protein/DNA-binding winged helix-turn-helix (wHTH) protein/Flp pilus assembly protein TadD
VSSLPDAVQVGDWRVEPELDVIARNGHAIKVEPRAMRVLSCLIARAGHVVSVEDLLEQAWPDVVVGPDSVYQAVGLLRRTLGDDRHRPVYIEHVPRKGYRLIAPVGTAGAGRTAAADGTPAAEIAPAPAAAAPRAPTPAPGAAPGNRIVWAALAVAAASLAVTWLLVRDYGRVPGVPGSPAVPPTIRSPSAAAAAAAPSIAVLPFLDLSEKHDLGYFADGLSEELIDLLARGSDLRVPARTSSFYFRNKPATVAEMARALKVDHLLEGSVRRSGKRVRVTAQLIRADSGYHLWSQTYDRDLDELFAVEDDIARAVTASLSVKLKASLAPSPGAILSTESHNRLLECQFFVRRNTGADIGKALECWRSLLVQAPQNAAVWAGYADTLWRVPFLTDSSDAADALTRAESRAAAEHALQLDPHLAAAHATLAVIHRVAERNWSAADAEVRAALDADPEDPASLLAAAALARDLGQFDRAIDYCQRARARDPLNFVAYSRLGVIYLYLGRLPEAEAAVRRRLDLSPEGIGGHLQLSDVLLARGAAQAALETALAEPNESSRLAALARSYHALGRRAEADAAFAEFRRKFPGALLQIAETHAARGEIDSAFAALDAAAAGPGPDSELLQIQSDPYFKALHADARYQALLRKLRFPSSGPA